MNLKKYIYLIYFFFCIQHMNGQSDSNNELNMPSHTFMRFNKHFINPSLSIFGDYKSEFVGYYRNQWFEYNQSPKTYMIGYSGNNYEKSGYGLHVFQQELGIWRNIGAVANYAKSINISESIYVSLGFNVVYFNSGLNKNKILTGEADPLLDQYENDNILAVSPGISFQIGKFNLGVYGENLADYNIKTSESFTEINQKTISSHLMFKHNIVSSDALLDNGDLTILARGNYIKMEDIDFSLGLLFNAPKAGWIQGSFSDFYGISGGFGINVTPKIAIGYNYEKGLNKEIVNLGPTHEVTLAFMMNSNHDNHNIKKKDAEKKNDILVKEINTLEIDKQTLEKEEKERIKDNIYSQTTSTTDLSLTKKYTAFSELAKKEGINYLFIPETNSKDKKGYYLVTGVYKDKNRVSSILNELKQKGFSKANSFENFKNKWHYVYLERFDSFEMAKASYDSKFNEKYIETLWILPIL